MALRTTDGQVVRLAVGARLVIGRAAAACDVAIADPAVSLRHAAVEAVAGGSVIVTDLESRNGTVVNGRRATTVAVRPDDRIIVGCTELRVTTDEPPADPTPPPSASDTRTARLGAAAAVVAVTALSAALALRSGAAVAVPVVVPVAAGIGYRLVVVARVHLGAALVVGRGGTTATSPDLVPQAGATA